MAGIIGIIGIMRTSSKPRMGWGRGRAIALVLASFTVGCGKKDDAAAAVATGAAPTAPAEPPAKASTDPHGADPHGADPHGADPHGKAGMGGGDRAVVRAAEGTIELTIDGTPQRIGFLPFGRNAAVWVEKNGVSRVTIGGAETEAGTPALSITVTGVRLDQVKLPITIGGAQKADAKDSAAPRITWQVGEKRIYRSQGGADAPEVVLESYAGGRLAGSFQGTLVMGEGKLDPPVKVRGTFDVSLRLNGVAPDRAD
jgi:hypothetical protein